MSNITHVTDETFQDEVINSDIPVLVDFWAIWCGPCKAVAPIIETISEEYSGKLKIVKVDVDENPATAAKFKIRAIPTMLFFNGSEEPVDHILGATSKALITETIDDVLDKI